MNPPAASRNGFTLVEVLLSILIVGFLFLTFYGAVDMSVAVTRVARENLRATQILLNRIEGTRLYNWNQLTDPNLFPTNFTECFNPSNTNTYAGITYTGTVTVATATLNPPANYSTNMYLVTVTVNWISGNVVRTRTMSTYCAKYGEQNYIFDN